jgi:hypothetical protein
VRQKLRGEIEDGGRTAMRAVEAESGNAASPLPAAGARAAMAVLRVAEITSGARE